MDAPVIGPSSTRISLPPWTVLGYRADGRPIFNLAGGSEDDEIEVDDDTSADEPDDEDDETDSGDADEETAKPKPPTPKADPALEKLQAEHARTVAALRKANDEAKRHRLALKDREARDRENEGEHERAIREAAEEVEKR